MECLKNHDIKLEGGVTEVACSFTGVALQASLLPTYKGGVTEQECSSQWPAGSICDLGQASERPKHHWWCFGRRTDGWWFGEGWKEEWENGGPAICLRVLTHCPSHWPIDCISRSHPAANCSAQLCLCREIRQFYGKLLLSFFFFTVNHDSELQQRKVLHLYVELWHSTWYTLSYGCTWPSL